MPTGTPADLKGMKIFFATAAVLLIGLSSFAKNISVRTSLGKVYGKSADLLDSAAMGLAVEYTPIELSFGENLKVVTELGYQQFSGSELNRICRYLAPRAQASYLMQFQSIHHVNIQAGLGAGVLFVERTGLSSQEFKWSALGSVAYGNSDLLPEFSVGIETGVILDQDIPINYGALFVRYLKSF